MKDCSLRRSTLMQLASIIGEDICRKYRRRTRGDFDVQAVVP